VGKLVVGAAILAEGRLLAAQRRTPPELAGLWEFPGGKVEPGETPEAALVRECDEELGVAIEVGALLGVIDVPVGTLRVYRAGLLRGEPVAHEHAALRWLTADELFDVPWIPVDLEVVRRLEVELRSSDAFNGGAPHR